MRMGEGGEGRFFDALAVPDPVTLWQCLPMLRHLYQQLIELLSLLCKCGAAHNLYT